MPGSSLNGGDEMMEDPGEWRSRQIRSSVRWFIAYAVVGLWVLNEFGNFPLDLPGGLLTDAILLVAFYKLVRVWDNRVWHANGSDTHLDDPLPRCTQRKGHWRCAGMNGHVGPHLFGINDKM
jgi:hypothetical protein